MFDFIINITAAAVISWFFGTRIVNDSNFGQCVFLGLIVFAWNIFLLPPKDRFSTVHTVLFLAVQPLAFIIGIFPLFFSHPLSVAAAFFALLLVVILGARSASPWNAFLDRA